MKFDTEELDQLADAVSEKVLARLRPLLSDKKAKDGDVIFTVETLAKYLDMGKSWVYDNVRKIPHFKVGRFPRFRKKDVDKWLESRKAPQYIAPEKRVYNL